MKAAGGVLVRGMTRVIVSAEREVLALLSPRASAAVCDHELLFYSFSTVEGRRRETQAHSCSSLSLSFMYDL